MLHEVNIATSSRRCQGTVTRPCPTVARPSARPRLALSPSSHTKRGPKPVHIVTPSRTAQSSGSNDKLEVYTTLSEKRPAAKPRVVVLGSGWGAMSFVKALPQNIKDQYDVVVLSPRNYFLYTPLLPAVATGTMEERSIVEPVRNFLLGKGEYYEAICKDIDPDKKELIACFPADAGLDEACFKMSYDVLILSVGSVNNTFGISGVDEYCYYFKTIEDASKLRRRVTECFERAALPRCPPEERKKLLSFVVAGGGPTGVEVAAELHDMIYEDLFKLYPEIVQDVSIHVVDLNDYVLSTYDRAIGKYTSETFTRAGINLVMNTRVAKVEDGYVTVVNKQNQTTVIPFGACIWATGIAMNPLIKNLQKRLSGQSHFRSILCDEYLRVKGSNGSMFALGDAATIDQPKALDALDQLFDKADTDKSGKLSMQELCVMLNEASKEYSHLEEHARRLQARVGGISGLGALLTGGGDSSVIDQIDPREELTKEDFKDLLAKIDLGLRALPATAQVAQQQGQYLAQLFANSFITGDDATTKVPPNMKTFKYFHKGSLAYVGQDKAVMDVPKIGPVFGSAAGFLWKGYETYSQFSLRNRCLVLIDWLRTKIFGRDISRV